MPELERGFSFVELLSALTAASIALAGVLMAWQQTMHTSVAFQHSGLLHQELNYIANLMVQEVQQTGYFKQKVSYLLTRKSNPNPFLDQDSAPQVNLVGGCLVYRYDRLCAKNSQACTYSGFKLEGTAIKKRVGGIYQPQSAADCGQGSWQQITSENMVVTDFQFIPVGQRCWNLEQADYCHTHVAQKGEHQVTIPHWRLKVAARWRSDPSISYEIERTLISHNIIPVKIQ